VSRKKLVLIAIAFAFACVGALVAFLAAGNTDGDSSSGTHPVIFTSLVPIYVAVFLSMRKRKGCAKGNNHG
jgi:lysylphosphatidylglycerol synthetase-like protein (DUF2156 family)